MNNLEGLKRAFILWIALIPATIFAQKTSYSSDKIIKVGYSITGYLKGLAEGEKVTMVLWNSTGYHNFERYLSRQDSGYVKNGEFHISGIVPDGPRRYWLTYDDHKGNAKGQKIDLFIDNNEQIIIKSDSSVDKIRHGYIQHYVSIEGSPTNFSETCLEPARTLYFQSVGELQSSFKKAVGSNGLSGAALEGFMIARDCLNKSFYYNILIPRKTDLGIYKSNLFFLDEFETSGHASFWMDFYQNLNAIQKESFNGKWLKDIAVLSVGQPFPEFQLPTQNSTLLNLTDVVKKGRITIVHFWSANSEDRIKYQDEVREMYKKYHDKGLNVIGLFHDDNDEAGINNKDRKIDASAQWKGILNNEEHPWYNVADLMGKSGVVEKVYREANIPNATTNVILDSQGKIIAWNARGAILQYYLWKAFGE